MASTQTSGQGLNVHAVPVATTNKLKDNLGPPPRYEDIGRYRRIHQGARRCNNLHECDSVRHAPSTKATTRQALDRSHLGQERKRSGEATSPLYRGGRKTNTHGHGRHQGTAKTYVRAVDVKQRGASSTRSSTSITTRNGRSRNEGRVRAQRFNSADPPTLHRPPPPTYEESRKQSKYYATATRSPELQFEAFPLPAHSKGGRVCLGRDSRAGTIGSDANRIFRKGNRTHGVISEGRDTIRTTRLAAGEGRNREEVDNVLKEGKRAQSEKLKRPQRPVGKTGRSTSASSVKMASREKAKTLSWATYSSSVSHHEMGSGNYYLIVHTDPQRHFDFTDTIKRRLAAEEVDATAAREHKESSARDETASEEDGTTSSTQAVYEFEPDLKREGSDGYPRYKPSNLQVGSRNAASPKVASEDGDRTVHETVYSTEAVHDFEAFLASEAPRGASPVFCDGANRDFRMLAEMLRCRASSPSFEEEITSL